MNVPKGTNMQASVRMALVPVFKQQLDEADAVVLRMYSLGHIQPNYRIVNNPLRLNFVSKTQVSQCVDFKGSIHGFDFKPFKDILKCKNEVSGQFDVIGQVIESPELDNYGGNGKPGKKKPLKLIDHK
ncbi:nucleic acid-binding, OB-fold protein [Artemisia annua]|uniref:Nucleic acid-binding, OB-fold protein n=1 Tax=Artemisia annua TaxID=35608 RepID=A0A2U1Q0S1_ARTAN|nr:nucleic acid-binding, OB-fold protein [Artemisia annua]